MEVEDLGGGFPGDVPVGGADMHWVDGADRFVADRRGDEAVAARRRERWQRQQRDELTTLPAALDAAIGQQVTLVLRTGARDTAVVDAVGGDHVALLPRSSSTRRWVALAAVVAVESDVAFVQDPHELTPSDRWLSDVLHDLAAERSPVSLTLVGGAVVRGEVDSVGETVALRTDGPTAHARVELDAIVSIDLLR